MKRLPLLTVTALVLAAPTASADQVYHSEHLNFVTVGGAPLRSGFVQNIKAQGPTYTVTRDFFVFNPKCDGEADFHSPVATLRTNASGNAKADVFVRPAEVAGFEGVHGVTWTVHQAGGAIAYRTLCTAVTLD